AHVPRRDGQPITRMVAFFPLTGAEGDVESVLGALLPLERGKLPVEPTLAQELHAELAALRASLRQRFGFDTVVAKVPAMRRVVEQIELARRSDTALALIGEAGSGKEHVARVIHYGGERRSRAFVPFDCRRTAAIDLKLAFKRLLEDARDAGTPPGLRPGSVYFDGVEDLAADVQELVVEAFTSAGLDLRLMVGSARDLKRLLDEEVLRPEFYYLVTSVQIELVPLRRRREELRLLAQMFLESLNRGEAVQKGGFADDVWPLFERYNWPGNLDELQLVVSEARAAAGGELIRAADLPFRFRTGLEAQAVGPPLEPQPVPLEPLLEQFEREQLELALLRARWNKKTAAKLLGITRQRLYRRMEALKIEDREEPS
ncbi:MAG: sigma 54-interacting transcriptional regulator, partial [Planctomycetes bacterium]|nr:sigma 54-interacting transcriptional regulator [Planctomycetota bacterium]